MSAPVTSSSSSSSSLFTIGRLKEILKQQQQEEEQRKQNSTNINNISNNNKDAIYNVYQSHGMMTPIKGFWERPISSDVYRCPMSEPFTTLFPRELLPRSIQEKYYNNNNTEEDSSSSIVVVEVNRNHLVALQDDDDDSDDDNGENNNNKTKSIFQQGTTLNRRPLGGNLTNKLSEYTRGASGQCRPFRPGGIDHEELDADDDDNNNNNPFLSPQAIEDSLKPLHQGTEASWKDGTLITAPPGVDFKVGLSYQDVYGVSGSGGGGKNGDADHPTMEEEDGTGEKNRNNHDQEDDIPGFNNNNNMGNSSATQFTPSIKWDQTFLDDDSLFGSSDGDSDDDDDDDDDSDEDDDANKKQTKKDDDDDNNNNGTNDDGDGETLDDDVGNDQMDKKKNEITVSMMDEISGSDQEIDDLLIEFAKAEARTKNEIEIKKKKNNEEEEEATANANPLDLAQHQAQLQQRNASSTARKSWASTTLLPIDDFHSWIPNPAMEFPFTLDPFQQQAVARLERNESVFVAAHTSAGKTVVAEYACALAKQRGTRCVYTSPIKALSNQKFRDFSTKFGPENVGLVTGDLQLNVDDSTCLIMTTEILRSMLYRGADLIRDIEWVIFDEVHYVNDTERGVVWEEVIIMLPSYVNLIFLSATTPNTLEFSDWIGRTKRKPVHVIKTDYRPVPLSHYLWADLKLHKIMEGKSGFLDNGYTEAANALKGNDGGSAAAKKKGKDGGKNDPKAKKPAAPARGPAQMSWQVQGSKNHWMSLVRFLEREELTPTVVFSFSKKKCEEIAFMLRSLGLNTAAEKSLVKGFTIQTVARLSPNDAVLPQVVTVCEMVERGIGVHHGGLLPILKEMVEILFSRNLIKVLFATETFAMGVNMPARSVVFNSIRKHDGTQFRVLQPGEYTQMAGRAGRRGLDKVGTVITACCFGDTPPPQPILRQMLTGSSTMLRSQFRLTYNMILNLLRVEEMSVESMIKRSFSEFATQRALTANDYPKLLARGQKTLVKLDEQLQEESSKRVGAEDVDIYFSTCNRLMSANSHLLKVVLGSTDGSADNVLQPGRVLLVSAARKLGVVRAPALVLQTKGKVGSSPIPDRSQTIESVICMVLLPKSYVPNKDVGNGSGTTNESEAKAVAIGSTGLAKGRHYGIYEISLDQILLVASTKQKIDPKLLFKDAASKGANTSRQSLGNAFFGVKPASRGFDDAFAGVKSRGKKNDDDDFFGKKKTAVSSESDAIESAVDILTGAEKEEYLSGLPPLDLRENLKRGNDVVEFRKQCGEIEDLVYEMRQYASHRHPTLEKHYTLVERKHTLQERVDALSHLLSNESLQLFPDFLQRKAVLRTLGYLDESETVCVKGRVACEVNTCEELIVTEMVFEGVLNDLEPTEIVAALSSLVYQERKSGEDDEFDMEIPETLLNCCQRMKKIAENLGQLQKEHGLNVDPLEYCENSLKFGLVHVVYEWALGVPFSNICELTLAQEGSIVRCITRLDELCREVRNCARVVGNPTLYRKMEAASTAIKRDIVFASSLYVS